jgi:bifunctional non-homologous end joining protein LigD
MMLIREQFRVRLILMRRVPGIFMAEYEQGDIAHDLFGTACCMGLEGIVSKRRERAYERGRCKHWDAIPQRGLWLWASPL